MTQQQRQKQQRERQAYRWQSVQHAAARVVWSGVAVCAGLAVAAPAQVQTKTAQTPPAVTQSEAGEGLQQLQRFLRGTRQGQARFTQTVSMQRGAERSAAGGQASARAGADSRRKNTVRSSSGSLRFLRPKYLRMEYQQPYRQEIVADGQKMWFYDADLEQVSVRPQSSVVVAETPLAALLTARTLGDLRSGFSISEGRESGQKKTATAQQDVVWVTLLPRRSGGQLRRLTLAFDRAGSTGTARAEAPRLRVLESHDGFGQVSVVRLDYAAGTTGAGAERSTLTPADFAFAPPQGVPVFEQPVEQPVAPLAGQVSAQ